MNNFKLKYETTPFYATLVFFAVLIIFYAVSGTFSLLNDRPQSVHMWAMCDRGSVARNYAQDDMNFFKPRVHLTREGEGITGLEFPFMNYLAALFYKLFGFNEFWYRFLMLLVYTAGLFACFKISGFFIKNVYLRTFGVLAIAASPVMTYYSASFIPDTASFGFAMMAWYCFFTHLKSGSNRSLWGLWLTITLAVLIKLTSAIYVIIMLCLLLWSLLRKEFRLSDKALKYPVLFLLLGSALLLSYAWYEYAAYLSETYRSNVFLMKSMRPESIGAVKNVLRHVNEIWVPFYFSKPVYILLGLVLLFVIWNLRKLDQKLGLILAGSFLGVFSFVYLMLIQFGNHDYYIITLTPLLFFLLLTAFEVYEKKFLTRKRQLLVVSVLLALTVQMTWFDRKHQQFRSNENCWLYDWSRFKDYLAAENYVVSLGLSRVEKTISIFDDSPNITLYLLNLKGWSIFHQWDDEPIREALNHYPKYLVISDSLQLRRPVFTEKPPKKIGQFNSIGFYELR